MRMQGKRKNHKEGNNNYRGLSSLGHLDCVTRIMVFITLFRAWTLQHSVESCQGEEQIFGIALYL